MSRSKSCFAVCLLPICWTAAAVVPVTAVLLAVGSITALLGTRSVVPSRMPPTR